MAAPIYKKEDIKIVFKDNEKTGACNIIENATAQLDLVRDETAGENGTTYYHGIACFFNDKADRDEVYIVDKDGTRLFHLDLQDGLRLDLLSIWVRDNTMKNVL